MGNATSYRTYRLLRIVALLLAFAATSVAHAHDVWLHPERGKLSKGDTLIVRLLVGSDLEADLSKPEGALELPVLWHLTPRFELITPDGSIDLRRELTEGGKAPVIKPVLQRTLDFDGLALVSMDHEVIYTSHTVENFLKYLEHEEFDKDKFRDHMGSRPEQSEVYGRGLQTLVQVGAPGNSDLYKRVLGQPIEIVLLQNPHALDPGEALNVQVLFEGKTLPDKLIKAYNSDGQALACRCG